MKKFILLILIIAALSACSANKFTLGKITMDLGKLPTKNTDNYKDQAALFYSDALAAKAQGDFGNYFFYLYMAFSLSPHSKEIADKFVPFIYYVGKDTPNVSMLKEVIRLKKWAKKYDVKNPTFYLFAAKSYIELKKYKKADKTYREGLKLFPDDVDLLSDYYDLISLTKGYADTEILNKLYDIFKNDEEKRIKMIRSVMVKYPEVAMKYSKKLFQEYNDKKTFELLIINYSALKKEDLALKMIWERLKEKKDITDDLMISFFMSLSNSPDLVSMDSLKTLVNVCDKKNYQLLYSYFLLLEKNNLYSDAFNCYQKAIKDTGFVSYLKGLGNGYFLSKTFYIYLRAKKFDEMEKFLSNLKSDANLKYSTVFSFVQDFEDSLKSDCKNMIENFKNPDIKHFYLAAYYEGLGDKKTAYKELNKLSKNFKKCCESVTGFLINQYIDVGNDIPAAYKVAKYMKNDSLSVNYFFASILHIKKKDSLAVKYIIKDFNKENLRLEEILYMINLLDSHNEYYDDILKICKKFEDKYSNDPYFLNGYGYFIADKGFKNLYPKAEKLLLKANKLSPNNEYYIDSLSWLYYKMGKLDKAIEWFDKIDIDKVENNEIAYHYGMIKIKQRKLKEAKKGFRLAIKINDNPKYTSLSRQKLSELGERVN